MLFVFIFQHSSISEKSLGTLEKGDSSYEGDVSYESNFHSHAGLSSFTATDIDATVFPNSTYTNTPSEETDGSTFVSSRNFYDSYEVDSNTEISSIMSDTSNFKRVRASRYSLVSFKLPVKDDTTLGSFTEGISFNMDTVSKDPILESGKEECGASTSISIFACEDSELQDVQLLSEEESIASVSIEESLHVDKRKSCETKELEQSVSGQSYISQETKEQNFTDETVENVSMAHESLLTSKTEEDVVDSQGNDANKSQNQDVEKSMAEQEHEKTTPMEESIDNEGHGNSLSGEESVLSKGVVLEDWKEDLAAKVGDKSAVNLQNSYAKSPLNNEQSPEAVMDTSHGSVDESVVKDSVGNIVSEDGDAEQAVNETEACDVDMKIDQSDELKEVGNSPADQNDLLAASPLPEEDARPEENFIGQDKPETEDTTVFERTRPEIAVMVSPLKTSLEGKGKKKQRNRQVQINGKKKRKGPPLNMPNSWKPKRHNLLACLTLAKLNETRSQQTRYAFRREPNSTILKNVQDTPLCKPISNTKPFSRKNLCSLENTSLFSSEEDQCHEKTEKLNNNECGNTSVPNGFAVVQRTLKTPKLPQRPDLANSMLKSQNKTQTAVDRNDDSIVAMETTPDADRKVGTVATSEQVLLSVVKKKGHEKCSTSNKETINLALHITISEQNGSPAVSVDNNDGGKNVDVTLKSRNGYVENMKDSIDVGMKKESQGSKVDSSVPMHDEEGKGLKISRRLRKKVSITNLSAEGHKKASKDVSVLDESFPEAKTSLKRTRKAKNESKGEILAVKCVTGDVKGKNKEVEEADTSISADANRSLKLTEKINIEKLDADNTRKGSRKNRNPVVDDVKEANGIKTRRKGGNRNRVMKTHEASCVDVDDKDMPGSKSANNDSMCQDSCESSNTCNDLKTRKKSVTACKDDARLRRSSRKKRSSAADDESSKMESSVMEARHLRDDCSTEAPKGRKKQAGKPKAPSKAKEKKQTKKDKLMADDKEKIDSRNDVESNAMNDGINAEGSDLAKRRDVCNDGIMSGALGSLALETEGLDSQVEESQALKSQALESQALESEVLDAGAAKKKKHNRHRNTRISMAPSLVFIEECEEDSKALVSPKPCKIKPEPFTPKGPATVSDNDMDISTPEGISTCNKLDNLPKTTETRSLRKRGVKRASTAASPRESKTAAKPAKTRAKGNGAKINSSGVKATTGRSKRRKASKSGKENGVATDVAEAMEVDNEVVVNDGKDAAVAKEENGNEGRTDEAVSSPLMSLPPSGVRRSARKGLCNSNLSTVLGFSEKPF